MAWAVSSWTSFDDSSSGPLILDAEADDFVQPIASVCGLLAAPSYCQSDEPLHAMLMWEPFELFPRLYIVKVIFHFYEGMVLGDVYDSDKFCARILTSSAFVSQRYLA